VEPLTPEQLSIVEQALLAARNEAK
jgi:hypothetical protein